MRNKLLTAFFAVALVCIGLATTAGRGSAHEPHPGLNFWIAVDGVPNCSTQNGDGTCDIAPGVPFVVGAHLDPLPGDLPHYDGYDVELRHQGVTPNHDASSDAWPDCAFFAQSYDESTAPDRVIFGCAIGVPPAQPSTYTGLMGTVSFVCAASGSLQLAHGTTRTDVLDDQIQGHAEDPNTSETLTINCGPGGAVPPTPALVAARTIAAPGDVTPLEPKAAAQATSTAQSAATATAKAGGTATRATPTPGGGGAAGSSSGGLAGWAIALIIVGGVAAAGAAGVVGWRVMQTRRAGGPPPPT